MSYDFQLETKLINTAPELHKIFSNNVLCVQNMLNKYQSVFPNYTDHTVLHSLEVIAFCNELVGDNIDILNEDEIFILLMAAYLHDAGMGLSKSDFEKFSDEIPQVKEYIKENPNDSIDDVIRIFHHEFSGKYIEKYSMIFDFPSKEYLFAVIQASRGHRKTDLFDNEEYPRELKMPSGNVVHLPYIATLIRLADELDIAADRNIQFLYDLSDITNEISLLEFKKHQAIKQLVFNPKSLVAYVDYSDSLLADGLDDIFEKLNKTLSYCIDVVEKCTPFTINQKTVEVKKILE